MSAIPVLPTVLLVVALALVVVVIWSLMTLRRLWSEELLQLVELTEKSRVSLSALERSVREMEAKLAALVAALVAKEQELNQQRAELIAQINEQLAENRRRLDAQVEASVRAAESLRQWLDAKQEPLEGEGSRPGRQPPAWRPGGYVNALADFLTATGESTDRSTAEPEQSPDPRSDGKA